MTLRRSPMRRDGRMVRSGGKRRTATRELMEQRTEARTVSLERAGHRCEMAALIPEIPCRGRLEVDEVQGRGVNPGAQYDASGTQVGCAQHHRWKTQNPKLAVERGLTQRSTFEIDNKARELR